MGRLEVAHLIKTKSMLLPERFSAMNSVQEPRAIPSVIWMLWDSGWNDAPYMQKSCMQSWKQHNPEYQVRALNLTQAVQLINRSAFVSDYAWNNLATIQAKSDIIRILLLARYGGVWADASLLCMEPLHTWLNTSKEFVAYIRRDRKVKPWHEPWVASWFLATQTDSYMIQTIKKAVITFWINQKGAKYEYYWLHRIVTSLYKSDMKFREHFDGMQKMSANGPHCKKYVRHIPQHVYKLKAPDCKVKQKKYITASLHKYF